DEALKLLEAQPPGPELVRAHAFQSSRHYVGAAYEEAIAAADKALSLATKLGLQQPANALANRGGARAYQGEPQGVEQMREALRLAVDRGEGRSAAASYNNLALVVWMYEGPQANLDLLREGIEFAQRRGITELAEFMAAGQPTLLAELGRIEEALAEASVADRLEEAGDVGFIDPRSLQLRLLAERGEHVRTPSPEPMLKAARDSGQPFCIAQAVAGASSLLHAQGHPQQARRLLGELDRLSNSRSDPVYVTLLPSLVRSALALNDPSLATSLTEGVHPLTPLHQHVLTSSHAQLAEAAGNHSEAASLYTDAAHRWHQFGNVPERGYALLAQGRCLRAIGDPAADQPLAGARELFALMGYRSALAETEALLVEQQPAAS
ncbi:MAG: hypothetical protein ACXVY8_04610, partial [Gaiellaceae bacterium]